MTKFRHNYNSLLGLIKTTSIQPAEDKPAITRTVLGRVAHGPIAELQARTACAFSCNEITNEELHDMVKREFVLDDMSAQVKTQRKTQDQERAIDILSKSIRYEHGKYTLKLPWKADSPNFPDTNGMVKKRVTLIESKLLSNAEFVTAYQNEIQKLLDKGYAWPVSGEELRTGNVCRICSIPSA